MPIGEDTQHPTEEEFERYALGHLGEVRQARLEEHLLLCASCRSRLPKIESFAQAMREALSRLQSPIDYVHNTEDGSIRLLAVQTAQGDWEATFSGIELQGAVRFGSFAEANEYLLASFDAMFPDHRCNEHCGSKAQ